VLALDGNRRPLGWIDATGVGGGNDPLDLTHLRPIGHTFMPATDSLRAVLDAVVLSPVGLAVAADSDGSLLGVASDDDIEIAIRTAAGRS
jgi:osmoprotectant transport system ATP-binding protein